MDDLVSLHVRQQCELRATLTFGSRISPKGRSDCNRCCIWRVPNRDSVILCPSRLLPCIDEGNLAQSSDSTFSAHSDTSSQLVHQLESPLQASEPFLLTGLLANYNKFESHNQYRVRLADFVNEETMTKVVQSIGWTTTVLRERYIAIQDDTPAGWSIGGTLSYVGLGSLAGAKKPAALVLTEDQQKELFAEQ